MGARGDVPRRNNRKRQSLRSVRACEGSAGEGRSGCGESMRILLNGDSSTPNLPAFGRTPTIRRRSPKQAAGSAEVV